MGKRMDRRHEELVAHRIIPRIDRDVDYENPAAEWFSVLCCQLDEIGKNAFVTTITADALASQVATESLPFGKKNPYPAPLVGRFKLNLDPSPRDTRHLSLSLAESGLTYEVGEAIATLPQNEVALVDEILGLLPFNVTFSVTGSDGHKLPLRDALLECYDIRTVTKSLLKKWAPLTSHPYLHAVMENDEELSEIIEGREIVDLITDFPADFKGGQEFVDLVRQLQPRLYSIGSSPKAHPDEVHLTVAKVTYNTHGRIRKGVCSTFLCEELPESGGRVKVFMQPTKHFKLPHDASRDIIMVGPGTGIAPFRAFLEERQATAATGRNWLFFGNPHEAIDYFYKDEFDAMAKSGFLHRLDNA